MKKLRSVVAIVALVAVAGMFAGCQKQEKAPTLAPVENKVEAVKPAEAPAAPAATTEAAPAAPAPAKE